MSRIRKRSSHDAQHEKVNGSAPADSRMSVLAPADAPAAEPEVLRWEPLSTPAPPLYDDAYAGAALVDTSMAAYAHYTATPPSRYDDTPFFSELVPDPPSLAEVADAGWARELRRLGRIGVWGLPLAAISLALSALWGWPEPGVASARPGTWLLVTLAGLILGVIGTVSLMTLLAATPGRRWSMIGMVATVVGAMLLAPVLGVIGLARPAVTNASARIPAVAGSLHANLIDGTVARWLTVGGLTLLAVGLALTGIAVLASQVMTRVDGYLILLATALASVAAWGGWQVLLVIAGMILLAAGLGVAWTAARLSATVTQRAT